MTIKHHLNQKTKRAIRVRSKIHGTASHPRLSVSRSSQHLQAQLINDDQRLTLLGLSTSTLKKTKNLTKTDLAKQLGTEFAKLALKQDINQAIFDRGGNRYHGRIKAFAQSARDAGLKI